MKKLAALVFAAASGLAPIAHAQDAKAGETKAQMCFGCHGLQGYQASFPEVHRVPMISGQNPKYIVASLNAYKKGERKHPSMRAVAGSLSDQDMADLAAFYSAQADKPAKTAGTPPADVAKLLEKGGCVGCHGADFNKAVDPSYPKLAGQHDDYLFVALKAYKTEGNASVGRANPIMSGMVKQFSNAELKTIAAWIGSLPGELHTVQQNHFK
jgi:cytochrome c553